MIKRFSELSIEQLARSKGYNIGPVYHGTEKGGFTVFDPEQTFKKTGFVYFSSGKGTAASYSGSNKILQAGK